MENINILDTVVIYTTIGGSIIELLKIIIPAIMTGGLGIFTYLNEIKREKQRLLINDKLKTFNIIKHDITEYYLEILKYIDSIQQFNNTELDEIIGSIIAKRLKFNESNLLYSIYFDKEEIEQLEEFANNLMKYELKTRNNLYVNNKRTTSKKYDDIDVDILKKMYIDIMSIINKKLKDVLEK